MNGYTSSGSATDGLRRGSVTTAGARSRLLLIPQSAKASNFGASSFPASSQDQASMTITPVQVFSVLASCSTMCMNLSPALSIYRIHKQKSCGEVQVLPLLTFWGSCHIWMMYGYLSGNIFPLFVTLGVGSILAITYLSVYVRFTAERDHVRKLLTGVFLWNALILLFSFSGKDFMGITTLSKSETGDWVGYIADVVSVMLYASPFATLAHVIKTKSVATIPIAMVVVGAGNNSLWVIYGFLASDTIVVVANVICVLFGFVQTVIYVMFSSKGVQSDLAQEPGLDVEKKDTASLSTVELDRSSYAADGHSAFLALKSPV